MGQAEDAARHGAFLHVQCWILEVFHRDVNNGRVHLTFASSTDAVVLTYGFDAAGPL
jgi:hypothetical protein